MALTPDQQAQFDALSQMDSTDNRYADAVAPTTQTLHTVEIPSQDAGNVVLTAAPVVDPGTLQEPAGLDKPDVEPARAGLLDYMWHGIDSVGTGAALGMLQAPFKAIQGIARNGVDLSTDIGLGLSQTPEADAALIRRKQAVLNDLLEHSVTDSEELIHSMSDGTFQASAEARGFKSVDDQRELYRDLIHRFQDPTFSTQAKIYTTLSGSDVLNQLQDTGKRWQANELTQMLAKEGGAFAIGLGALKGAAAATQLGKLPFFASQAGKLIAGVTNGVVTSDMINPASTSNIANWVQENVPHSKALTQYLAADPNDSFIESKTKQALQDAATFAILDVVGEKLNRDAIQPIAQNVKAWVDGLQLNKHVESFVADQPKTAEQVAELIGHITKTQESEPITDAAARYSKSTEEALDDVFPRPVAPTPEGPPQITVTATKGENTEEITFPASEAESQISQLKDAGYEVSSPDSTKVNLQVHDHVGIIHEEAISPSELDTRVTYWKKQGYKVTTGTPVTRGGDRRVTVNPKYNLPERRSGVDRRSVVEKMVDNNPAAKAKLDAKVAEFDAQMAAQQAEEDAAVSRIVENTPTLSKADAEALEAHIFNNLKTKGDTASSITEALLGVVNKVRDIGDIKDLTEQVSGMIDRSLETLKTSDPEAYAAAQQRLNIRLKQDIDYLSKVTGQSKEDLAKFFEEHGEGSSVGNAVKMRARGMVLDALMENLSALAKKKVYPDKFGVLNPDEALIYNAQKVISGILTHDLMADASSSGTNLDAVKQSIGNMKKLMSALRSADTGKTFDKALADMNSPDAGKDIFAQGVVAARKGAAYLTDFGINNMLLRRSTMENIGVGNLALANIQALQKVVGSGFGVLDMPSAIEGASTLAGQIQYLGKALTYARRSFLSGRSEFIHATNAGTPTVAEAATTPLGSAVNFYNSTSARLISALDALTTTPAASGLLRGKALNSELSSRGITNMLDLMGQVKNWGDITEASGNRFSDALNGPNGGINPLSDIGAATIKEAKGWTLQQDLQDLLSEHPGDHALRTMTFLDQALSAVDKGAQFPITKFFAPFRKAMGNAVHLAYEHSPVGMAGDAYNLASGQMSPADRSQYLGRVATATTIGAATWQGLQSGNITGPGPRDPNALKLLQQQHPGWQPYSVRTTNPDGTERFTPFSRVDIIGPVMVQTIRTINAGGLLTDGKYSEAVSEWFQGMVDSLGTDRYGSGVKQLVDATLPFLQGRPEEAATNLVKLLPRQITARAIPGIVGESNKDDILRADRHDLSLGPDVSEAISRTLPGQSVTLEPEYGIYGQEQSDPTGVPSSSLNGIVSLSEMFNPNSTTYKPDQVEKAMMGWAMQGYNVKDALTSEMKQVGNTYMHLREFKSGQESALAAIQKRRAGGSNGFDYIVPGGMKGYLKYIINLPEYKKALNASKQQTGPNTSVQQPDEQWKMLHNAIADYEHHNFQDFIDTHGNTYVGPAGNLRDSYYANRNNANVRQMPDATYRDALLPQNPPAGDIKQPPPKNKPVTPTLQMQQEILNALPRRR